MDTPTRRGSSRHVPSPPCSIHTMDPPGVPPARLEDRLNLPSFPSPTLGNIPYLYPTTSRAPSSTSSSPTRTGTSTPPRSVRASPSPILRHQTLHESPRRPNHHRRGSDFSLLSDGRLVHLDDPTPEAARARTSQFAMKPKRCNTTVSQACSEIDLLASARAQAERTKRSGSGGWFSKLRGILIPEKRVVRVVLRWDRPYRKVDVPARIAEFEAEGIPIEDVDDVDVLLGLMTMDGAVKRDLVTSVQKSLKGGNRFPEIVAMEERLWGMLGFGEEGLDRGAESEYLEYLLFLITCILMHELQK